MNRRDALRTLAGGLALGAMGMPSRGLGAAEAPKTGLGVAVYCLGRCRRVLKQQDPQRDLFDPMTFLDFCRRLGAGGIQAPLGVRDREYAATLRAKAEQYGMFIEAIAGPPRDATQLERFDAELETAARVGVRAVRTVIMPGRRYERFGSAEEFRRFAEQGRKALELAAPLAEKHRVRLAVENHKDQRVPERLELLQQISSEYVGACVDTGNSFALLEDPIEVVEAYAPWAFSVHLKDQAVGEYDDGFLLADAPLGKGFLDLKQMVAVLRKAQPEVRFTLETITRDPLKVPCLTEEYWATFADLPGRGLARTLRTVRTHAAEQLPKVDHLPLQQQAAVEKQNVEQSLEYARTELFQSCSLRREAQRPKAGLLM